MSPKVSLILYSVSVLAYYVQSSRILAVFPFPSFSHQVVFRKLTLELVNRGHDVTVITPDPAFPSGGAPQNLKEINLHEISYKTWQKEFLDTFKVKKNFITFTEMRKAHPGLVKLMRAQLKTPEVQEILTNKSLNYEVILVESLYRPGFAFSHIFKAPMILVSSLGAIYNNHQVMGSLIHPLLYPNTLRTRIYNLTFWEKLEQLYNHYSVDYASHLNEAQENALIREIFGSEVPPLGELYNNVDMLFLNLNPIWADNQPVPTNVIYMGGIHQIPRKNLPDDLRKYLDSSKHGVIYLSFGTNVLAGMIPTDKVEIIVKVLSKLQYDVLWKWDKEELPGKSDNIKISKWFPQSDLLRHPKVKLFITQAGLQSTDEAITAGVPLVAVPMLGDQWYNAEKYVKFGIGKHLDIETFTEDIFKEAVETVIKDKSYRINIVKLQQMMQDQPETPLERAVWWTEYVIRNGGAKQLRATSANISFEQYFEVELILLLILSVLIVALVLIMSLFIQVIKFVNNLRCRTTIKMKTN